MGRWVSAVGLVALTACGPEVAEEAPPCEELRRQGSPCEQLTECAGCFSIGADGVGTCRGIVSEIDEAEMAAALAGSVSAADYRKTECPDRTIFLDRVAADAVVNAGHFAKLDDLKSFVSDRDRDDHVEVRVNAGCNAMGRAWPGLELFVRISADDPAPSCCVGPDCGGADFRCEWPASEGAPTPCTPAD